MLTGLMAVKKAVDLQDLAFSGLLGQGIIINIIIIIIIIIITN